jgi:hypothetical protein
MGHGAVVLGPCVRVGRPARQPVWRPALQIRLRRGVLLQGQAFGVDHGFHHAGFGEEVD